MKKILLSFLLILAAGSAWAYNFSAVAPSGQTLYYNITGSNVSVTYPGTSTSNPWGSYTKPTGALTIPSSVTHNGQTYSVTSIDWYAFACCSGLTSVTIPNSVTSIGNSAFAGCSGLQEITSLAQVAPVLSDGSFSGVTSTIPVNIPCGSLISYSSRWSYFSNFVESAGYSFSATTADSTRGVVQVLTEPTCTAPTAVIYAAANSGYHFDRWSDNNTQNPRTIALVSDTAVIAYFLSDQNFTITVVSNDPAMGSVTGSGTFADGTNTTITATANAGYRFVQWQDGNTESTRTITVTADATYTAYFEADGPTQYTITVVSADSTMGSVTGSGTFAEGTNTTITATANAGYRFVQWQDGNTEHIRTITVTADATYTAYFDADGSSEGIADAGQGSYTVRTAAGRIVVEGAENETVRLFDCMGRCLQTVLAAEGCTLEVPAAGVYLLQIGNNPAQKVVVLK